MPADAAHELAEPAAVVSAAAQSPGATMRQRRGRRTSAASGTAPSYAESEWIEIIRRQRKSLRQYSTLWAGTQQLTRVVHFCGIGARPGAGTLKLPQNTASSTAPSPVLGSETPDGGQTYPPLASKGPPRLANEWEFSGWGSVGFVELDAAEIEAAVQRREEDKRRNGHEVLGAWCGKLLRFRTAQGPKDSLTQTFPRIKACKRCRWCRSGGLASLCLPLARCGGRRIVRDNHSHRRVGARNMSSCSELAAARRYRSWSRPCCWLFGGQLWPTWLPPCLSLAQIMHICTYRPLSR